jgi:hypothetical protein
MNPSYKRFQADDLARLERYGRLEPIIQSSSVDGISKLDGATALEGVTIVHVFVIQRDSISAGALYLIKCKVGLNEQVFCGCFLD